MAHGFIHYGIVSEIIHVVLSVMGLYLLYSISKSMKRIADNSAYSGRIEQPIRLKSTIDSD